MMIDDDNDGQMIFVDLGGLKLPNICLTGEEKPRKNLTQETCPDRASNPGPLRDRHACYCLAHSGGRVWILHALSQNHKNQQVAIFVSLLAPHRLAREQHRLFLSCIITGDEEWCFYPNIRKRKEWLSQKKREEYVGNVSISPLGTPFSSVHGSTHYLYWKLSNYFNIFITEEELRVS